ncbi:hypothetical protein Syun_019565 [Stephania yunnanensis]|uniref:Large ribosomal subunit protein bL12 C-terminal domain-containing protein n=1 Tax=Stephania yunnanensis TaxID=152371 RepID=A0AAP0IUE4_9MAGN
MSRSYSFDLRVMHNINVCPHPSGGVHESKAAEKTAFDLKLEKFDAAAKIKIIKEVRSFTNLGLKEAKELVEKRTKRPNRKPCLVEMEICDLVKVLC